MKQLTSFLIWCTLFTTEAAAVGMTYEDRIRIKEAISISSQVSNDVWTGINDIPFVVLLVTDSTEFLINHPYPSDDFKSLGYDSLLLTTVYWRARQFPSWYLATFPAVNGVTCIVVGTPENTKKTSSEWVITLIHEHFHQLQFGAPGYFEEVNKLDLSGGDESGMWQLNYPFPYDSAVVVQKYNRYVQALSKAVSSINTPTYKRDVEAYLSERKSFKKLLKPADYRYFSFQVWQEGLARYTEYKFLKLLKDYKPSKEMTELPGYLPFIELAEAMFKHEMSALTNSSLSVDKRICFYSIGFAEGLLLDKLDPEWHENYLAKKFFIEAHIPGY